MCHHMPECPDAQAPDAMAARVVAGHPEQGWSLLCDGVVLFEDAGELLPGGQAAAQCHGVKAGWAGGRLQVMVTLCDWRGFWRLASTVPAWWRGVDAGAAGQAVPCGCGRFSLAELRGK